MKEGFTVDEIEKFGKAHKMTILLSVILILSAICNAIFWDTLSIWMVALGGVAGLCFPDPIFGFLNRLASFVGKQERTVRLIFAGVALAVAVVFPPLHFLTAGLIVGLTLKYKIGSLHATSSEAEKKPKLDTKSDASGNDKKSNEK